MKLPDIAALVPHAGDAVLLDRVIDYDEESLRAVAIVRPNVFSQPDGSLAAWMGLEILAQAVAAWAGCQAWAEGAAPRLGFLLGTRRYTCHVPRFPAGAELHLEVVRSLYDAGGMAVFECTLDHAGARWASARLNVYSPPDAASFMQEPS
jgi:predicted hotdog family 3-hydroxylacyl-ACP dehydratase